jgi:hypothetical protein
MKKIKQSTQINKSTTYDDTLASGVTLESAAASLEDDLNAIRSQLEKIIGTGNWYDVYVAPADSDELVKVSLNDTTPGYLEGKIAAGTGISISTVNEGADEDLTITCTVTNTDQVVKVTSDDTTSGYLLGKLVAGSGITLTEGSPGGNETLTVATTVVNTDQNVKVTSNDTTSGYLLGKLVAGAGVSLTENNDGAAETLTIAALGIGTDELTKVTSNDTTPGYLLSKVVAGTGITVTETDDGLNEKLTIASTIVNTDQVVKVTSDDTTSGYLLGKLVAGSGITLTEGSPGGNETLTVATTVTNTDQVVKVTSNDTTSGYLLGKLVAGAGVSLTENDDGLDETLIIAALGVGTDELAKVTSNDTTPGYLFSKVVAGTGISVTETDDGLNEKLTVACTVVNTDQLVRTSAADDTAQYLESKVIAGAGITVTKEVVPGGGNVERLSIASTVTNTDQVVKVTSDDTTSGYLLGKLVAGSGITLTEGSPGGNETLTVATTVVNTDQVVKVSSDDSSAGYLNGKLIAGTGITLTEAAGGGGGETFSVGLTPGYVASIVTLDNAVDNQGATPVTSSATTSINMAHNTGWVFRNSAGIARVSLLAGATGLGSFSANVDTFIVNNTNSAEFMQGMSVDSNDFPIDIGVVAGQINFTGAGDKAITTTGTTVKLRVVPAGVLELDAGTDLTFQDQYKVGSEIFFSRAAADWTDYNTLFNAGDTVFSLLRAVYSSAFVSSVDGTIPGIGTLENIITGSQGIKVVTESSKLVLRHREISNDFFGLLPTTEATAHTGWWFNTFAAGTQAIQTSAFTGTAGVIAIAAVASANSGGQIKTAGRAAVMDSGEVNATLRWPSATSVVCCTGIFLTTAAGLPLNGIWAEYGSSGTVYLVSASSGTRVVSSSIAISVGTMYTINISWAGSTATLTVWNAGTRALIGSATITHNSPTGTAYNISHSVWRTTAASGIISYLDYLSYAPLALM